MKKFALAAILFLSTPFQISAAGAAEKTVLFFGDSLTAGLGLDPSQAFPAIIAGKIKSLGWKFKVINGGLSGDTSSDASRRIRWMLKRPIDVLVIELGANDGLRGVPVQVTRDNLQAVIDTAKKTYPAIKILLVGMRLPPNYGPAYVQQFERMFPPLAEKNHIELLPFLLEGVGGRPDLNLPDGMHPNAAGQKIVADNVWRKLRPMLEPLK